ncbi:MAG: hypothetical protein L6Q71_03565, partial [Planctomycetes bacterium]|nr:hypothetical protein [Planctomycetota bacterium]
MRFFLTVVGCVVGIVPLTVIAQEADKQDAEKKQATQDKPKGAKFEPGDIYDHADVMKPEDSFRYWLVTVNSDDKEFASILRAERKLDASKEFTAEELRLERERRIEASFDFEAFFKSEEYREEKPLTAEQKVRRRDEMTRLFLSEHARKKYEARNIRDVSAPEPEDWDNESAYVILTIKDLVSGKDVRYRVDMKVNVRGLMWRWYKSELFTGEVKAAPPQDSQSPAEVQRALIADYDKQIEELAKELATLKQRNEEIALEIARLEERRSVIEAQRAELERQRNPYGTPEATFLTAHKALRDGNWEKFLSCHAQRVRDTAGDAAKKRFEESVSAEEVKGTLIREVIKDADRPDRITLKVELTVSFRKVAAGGKANE